MLLFITVCGMCMGGVGWGGVRWVRIQWEYFDTGILEHL